MILVPVDFGDRSYEVHVGPGAADALAEVLATVVPGARRAAVVSQTTIPVEVDAGIEQQVFPIAHGEEHKSLATIEDLSRSFAQWGLTRGDVIVGVGGGLVTDVAGFAAATYHRGVPVVHVATSLLAQVDAAIGGKTGVNLPEGKNLVGAYWQPAAVLCDTDTLATLPPEEYRSGLGEVAKYHFLGGDGIDALPIEQQVARCVQIKADVVAADEREGGRRAILNYGHTLGHALETSGSYTLRHGEAVAVGLVFAAEVAHRMGRIDTARVAEHRRVVEGLGLSAGTPIADPDALLALFDRDKKAVRDVTMVLDGPNGVESVADLDMGLLRDALHAVAT